MMRLIMHLLIAVIPLRKQNILGAVGDTAPQGDVSGVASHNLDDTAALMGGRSITYLINRLHRRIYSSIKADGIIGAGNIQVDGSRKTYGIDSQRG